MYRLVIALLFSFLLPFGAVAGPNEGGVLIVHTDPSITYTAGVDYCDLVALDSCEDAVVQIGTSDTPSVWWVTAAFPPGASPRLVAATFGVTYDVSRLTLTDFGSCGDWEFPSDEWPSPFTGNAVGWFEVRTGSIETLYWFAGYSYYAEENEFKLRHHPTQGADFADDTVPAVLDPVTDFGIIGFSGADGFLPCPEPLPGAACCIDECECVVLTESDCDASGGVYVGGDCEPGICECPPSACCLPDGMCVIASEVECLELEGDFQPLRECFPNPCRQPRTGRCCFTDGSCTEIIEVECLDEGGVFAGERTRCFQSSCPAQCDPILRPSARPASGGNDGPNVGGVLILHHNVMVEQSSGQSDYCGESDLTSCREAVTDTEDEPSVILYALAAFPETTEPHVDAVEFAVYYPQCVALENWGGCGDTTFESQGFPNNAGTLGISFDDAQTDRLFEVAWFLVSSDNDFEGDFALGPSPNSSNFYDFSTVPSSTNDAVDFGVFGFRTDGYLPCPVSTPASCCFSDGSCEVLPKDECESRGGEFVPSVPACDPNPCLPTPTVEQSWGLTKYGFRGRSTKP